MIIYPAIDMIDEKVVRLVEGDFEKQSYYDMSVIDQVLLYKKKGFNQVHIINLSGTLNPEYNVYDLLRRIKKQSSISVQFGGGIRSIDDIKELITIGIDRIILSTILFQKFDQLKSIIESNTKTTFVAALDSKEGEIYIKGWKENTTQNLFNFIPRCQDIGISHFLVTDISKDGKLAGPNFELYRELQERFPTTTVIASGGVSGISDIEQLKEMKCKAVIVGKAIYENKLNLDDLSEVSNA